MGEQNIFMEAIGFLEALGPYAITFIIPLLATALGGLFSERSGVVNIALEGLMVVGSFVGALVVFFLQPSLGQGAIYISLLAAMAGGFLFSMLHAYASVNLGANQIISGTAINLLASSFTIFLTRVIMEGDSGKIQITNTLTRFDIPILSEIPFVGPLFFSSTYGTTWIVLALLFIVFYIVQYTPFGLRLRACGEHPHAADAAGVSVSKIRYMAVGISGALAGLGGAIVVVTYRGEFDGYVYGLGFLALASLIFGQWKSFGVLGATVLFGFALTLSNSSVVFPELVEAPGSAFKWVLGLFGEGAVTWWDDLNIPPKWLFDILPYLVTLVALIFLSKSSRAPKAIGEPFDKGKR